MTEPPLDQPRCSYEPCTRKRVFTSCDQCGKPYCSDHVRLRGPRRYLCFICAGEPAPEQLPPDALSSGQALRQYTSSASSSGGCLIATSVVFGLIFLAVTAFLLLVMGEANSGAPEGGLGVDLVEILWVIVGLPTGLISLICWLIYRVRKARLS